MIKNIEFRGIGKEEGIIVREDQAFDYALERCLNGSMAEQQEFKDALVEWYYSGNRLKEEAKNEAS